MDLAASIQAVIEEVGAAPDALARRGNRRRRICAWPAVWRSIASPTARCCATASSRTSGCSRLPAMPAARSARRLRPITFMRDRPRTVANWPDGMGLLSRSRIRAMTRSQRGLTAAGARFATLDATTALIEQTAHALADGKASAGSRAAWSSARARSAIARSSAIRARPTMQTKLNLKVKYRESFRPFAPCGAARGSCRVVRARVRQPLHADGRRCRSNASAAK